MSERWPEAELQAVGACPACLSPGREVLHDDLVDPVYGSPGHWTSWRCHGCGSAYIDPRPSSASIGRAYSGYFTHTRPAAASRAGLVGAVRERVWHGYLNAAHGYSLQPAWPAARALALIPGWRARAAKVIRHLHPTGERPRVLDVGCGNGEFLQAIGQLGWDAHGVDPDPQAVAEATRAGLSVQAGTIFDVDAGGAPFDAITLSHVIEHLHEPRSAMEHARALLRPGGMVWLATPNIDAIGHRTFGRHWFGLDPPRHLVVFTRRALIRLLGDAGFERAEALRSPANAGWLFGPSEEIAAGRSPKGMGPPRSRRLRLRAALASGASAVRPELGEELVVAAHAPAR